MRPIDKLAVPATPPRCVIVDASDGSGLRARCAGPQTRGARRRCHECRSRGAQLERRVGARGDRVSSRCVATPCTRRWRQRWEWRQPPPTLQRSCHRHEPPSAATCCSWKTSRSTRRSRKGYLAALGCTSVWVKDGPEAVARNAAERFDLILMDLSMPDMDGFATTALDPPAHGDGTARADHRADGARRRELSQYVSAGRHGRHAQQACTLEECARVLRTWIPAAAQKVERRAPARPLRTCASARRRRGDAALPRRLAGGFVRRRCRRLRRLRGLRGGGQSDLYAKLVDLFHTGSSESLTQLQAALRRQDLKAAAALLPQARLQRRQRRARSPIAKEVRQLEQLCAGGRCRCRAASVDAAAGRASRGSSTSCSS